MDDTFETENDRKCTATDIKDCTCGEDDMTYTDKALSHVKNVVEDYIKRVEKSKNGK